MMGKGLLISFDGTDSSGKETQSAKLVERLRARGRAVLHVQTPDYSTATGQRLRQLFQGKIGPLTWQEKMQLLAANRAEHKAEVVAMLQSGGAVIYDRYVPSSLAFIPIEALSAAEADAQRSGIQAAVAREEYDVNGMPREDLSLFLDVPPRLAAELLAKRQQASASQSEYTDALALQERLYREYELLCDSDPNHFEKIPCLDKQGNVRRVEDIAETIWQSVVTRFPEVST